MGLRVKTGWDDNRKVPTWSVKDPLSWLPDPRGNHVDQFRFHYFEESMLSADMNAENGFVEGAADIATNNENPQNVTNENYKNQAHGLQKVVDNNIPNHIVSVINGYTVFEGSVYSVTTDWKCTEILRVEELAPVTKEEKKDSTLVPLPVIVSWYSPFRGDPFGVSLVDLIEDKQKAHKILQNLRLISAKFATFGQQYLYDPRAVSNRNDLTKPSTNPKWIPYNSGSGVPIGSAIYPVPRENIMQDSWNVSQEMVRQIQTDTGIDSRALGVQGDENITLGEAQQIQANANVRFGLNVAVNYWSEKAFWQLWLRTYNEFFSGSDRKFIRIAHGFGSTAVEFRKDDFLGIQDPDITIESEANANSKRAKTQVAFAAKLPLILQDPNVPQVSKNVAMRYSLKLD